MLDLGRFMLMESIAFNRWLQAGATMPEISAGPAAEAEREGAPLEIDKSGIAVIPVVGMTNKRYRSTLGGLASYIGTSWAVQAAAADPKVKAIVLKIDSPGGYVDGVAEAADDIAAAAKVKRVVAQIDGLGASAGYWLASQASEVYAGRLDQVGSIGVLAVLYDMSGLAEKEGIKPVVFATGKYKWTGVPGTEITEAQREYMQGLVDQTGDAFVADIARGRRRSEADIRKVADGRVFGAADALRAGLIDGISSYPETISRMRGELLGAQTRDSRMRSAILDLSQRHMAARKI